MRAARERRNVRKLVEGGPVGFDAGGDRLAGVRAFDHHGAHGTPSPSSCLIQFSHKGSGEPYDSWYGTVQFCVCRAADQTIGLARPTRMMQVYRITDRLRATGVGG